jgi:hypothetical protein
MISEKKPTVFEKIRLFLSCSQYLAEKKVEMFSNILIVFLLSYVEIFRDFEANSIIW